MTNEELKGKAIETANWAMGFVSDCDEGAEAIDSESVSRVLDSTSKMLNQINEMERVKLEAQEKEASRLQTLEIEKRKADQEDRRIEMEDESNKRREKIEKFKIGVEIAGVVATLMAIGVKFYSFICMFRMHKNDDFMTGTEKDAFRQADGIDKGNKF